jgi:hypothetical protein
MDITTQLAIDLDIPAAGRGRCALLSEFGDNQNLNALRRTESDLTCT